MGGDPAANAGVGRVVMDLSAHCIPSPTCSFSRCKQVLSNNYHILILSRVYTQLLPPDSSSTFVHSFRLFLPLLGIRPVCSHTCSFRSQNRHTDSSFLPHFVLLSSPLGLMVVQLVSIGSHHFWLLPVGRHESLMISMGVWQFKKNHHRHKVRAFPVASTSASAP